MTDEERQKLCADLRNADLPDLVMCGEAADEIERLAKRAECVVCRNSFQSDGGFICDKCRAGIDKPAVAQSDAEPVRAFAKAVLHGDDEHKRWLLGAAEAFIAGKSLPAPRGKGTAPPRPDTSAGIIEAAEITREWAGATSSLVEAHLLDALARELRARAADRSGK